MRELIARKARVADDDAWIAGTDAFASLGTTTATLDSITVDVVVARKPLFTSGPTSAVARSIAVLALVSWFVCAVDVAHAADEACIHSDFMNAAASSANVIRTIRTIGVARAGFVLW